MMGSGRKPILIVEGNIQRKEQLKYMLESDYQLDFAKDTDTALKKLLNKGVYSAILLDAFASTERGFDFLRTIKKDCYARPPVIAIIEEYDADLNKKVLSEGADEFVLCPLEKIVVINRLENVIARSNIFTIDSNRYTLKYDTLTGIFNRHTMFEETNNLIHNRKDMDFCIVVLDVKRFSLYNTTFGEADGDNLLCRISDCLKSTLDNIEIRTYGRIGADVFAMCMEYDREFIFRAISRIRKYVRSVRNDYLIELAAGIYVIDDVNAPIESMFYKARRATDKQKTEYLLEVVIYDDNMERVVSNERIIMNEMHNALKEGQFDVYLQPKFSLRTGITYGAEALVRWNHPTRGVLSPSTFIPVFEKNGFIASLDYYMWDKVCNIIRRWIDAGITPTPISVNMSRISMYNPKVSELLSDLVKKYNINPKYIGVEITESAYMDNPELMKNTLHKLKEAGFIVMMDDFGSGYSSLNTLKDFDVDVVKIDMQFLPKHDNKTKGQIILSSVVDMVDHLKMETIIEGVETEEQMEYLQGIGCNMAQGYYFSKPVTVREYEEKILNMCS